MSLAICVGMARHGISALLLALVVAFLPGCSLEDDDVSEGLFVTSYGTFVAQYRRVGRFAIVGGDVVLPVADVHDPSSPLEYLGYGVPSPLRGQVTYRTSDELPARYMAPVDAAIASWNALSSVTGVNFVPARDGYEADIHISLTSDYFFEDELEKIYYMAAWLPSTSVDRPGFVLIHAPVVDRWWRAGGLQHTMVHELGHALGLKHEHQRPDRDEHIEVLWENLLEAVKVDYALLDYPLIDGSPYDYGSVMHYSPGSGSKDLDSGATDPDPNAPPRRTMRPLREVPAGIRIGHALSPSMTDARAVAALRQQ